MKPPVANLALYACFALGQLPFVLPLSDAWLLIPVLLTLPTWALLHEAIHANLHPSPRLNRVFGRTLSFLYGAPFAALRAGHLLHHRYSRLDDLSEAYDPAKTSRVWATLRHYATILGGLYWAEVGLSLLAWAPLSSREALEAALPGGEMSRKFQAHLRRPEVIAEIRLDGAVAIALLALSAWLHADHWSMWLAAVSARALLISFFDNAYHYGTAAGRPELARNHRFPGNASWLVLHFNFHGVHHLHPTLPWFRLPGRAKELGAACQGGFFSVPLRQLQGPLPLARLPQQG